MQKNNKRLLIVDDDKQIRELLVFDIAQSGYIVDCAIDGQEGLKKALENNYDLILLDVMMPKMNGYDVCKTPLDMFEDEVIDNDLKKVDSVIRDYYGMGGK